VTKAVKRVSGQIIKEKELKAKIEGIENSILKV